MQSEKVCELTWNYPTIIILLPTKKTILLNKIFTLHSYSTVFSAKVNLATCRISSVLVSLSYTILMIRMLYGPLNLPVVVFFHYLVRLHSTSLLTMMTFNRVLRTLFIIDFKRISLVPEEKVMLVGLVTFLTSVMYLLQEAAVRNFRGLNHFGRAFGVYLGKVKYYKCNVRY